MDVTERFRLFVEQELDNQTDDELPEYSDSEEDELVESSHDSDTEQSGDDAYSEEDSDEGDHGYYLGKDKETKWGKAIPNRAVRTPRHNLVTHLPGPVGEAKTMKTPIECWSLFINDDLITFLVECTNIYIAEQKAKYKNKSVSRNTDAAEMKALIGLLYLAGVFHSNRMNLDDLWETDGTGIDIFRTTMSLQRFRFLLTCLRFDNIHTRANRRLLDKLAPIRYVFETIVANFNKFYTHSEYVTIDEILAAFRGRCPFRQYIPNKPAKYGIKILALADAKTYYISKLEVYPGTQPPGPFALSNSAIDIVKRLIIGISGSGRNVTMDNWLMSYSLVVDLLRDHRLTVVGTVRKNKRELPLEFLAVKGRAVASSLFGFKKNVTLVSYVPKKNKNVLLMSTMHHDASIDPDTGDKQKPAIITFYNQTKGGVDTVDQLSAMYNTSRNSRRWSLTVFFSLLNIVGINSFVIFKFNTNDKVKRRHYLKKIGFNLISEYLKQRESNARLPTNLKEKIRAKTGSEETQAKRPREGSQQRCSVCPRSKDRKTKYTCQNCSKFICLEHTVFQCDSCVARVQLAEGE